MPEAITAGELLVRIFEAGPEVLQYTITAEGCDCERTVHGVELYPGETGTGELHLRTF